MKFVMLIFQGTTPLPGSPAWNALSKDEQARIYAEYQALNDTPNLRPGLPLGLPAAARTVTVRDGNLTVKAGTHLTESIGGYLVLEADTIDAAVEMAARVPAARLGGAIEIRPAEKYW